MGDDYFVVDIETCPLDMEKYRALDEDSKTELLNPIDSKIVMIGVRYNKENKIFEGEEKQMLSEFWLFWREITKKIPVPKVVGFSNVGFDMPFLTARSFIHGVTIVPFTLKQVIDLRDKINAYRYGPTRGKLKEYAELLKLTVLDVDGSDVAELYASQDYDTLRKYLNNDLDITDAMYLRAVETKIVHINKY